MSKDAKHTPGPWSFGAPRECAETGVRETPVYGDCIEIAVLSAYCQEESPMVEANTRLIASAPEMAEVLGILRGCETRPPLDNDPEQNTVLLVPPQVLERLCDTLTKALGKAGLL